MPRVVGKGVHILLLATDAHGGFGGIAQYNRDVIEAMSHFPDVREISVMPRSINSIITELPPRVSYDESCANGLGAYLAGSALRAFRGHFDMVYCAHINLMPVAAVIAHVRRVPLVLAIYGIDAWERPEGRVARWAVTAADLVLSISQITLDRFRSWSGVDAGRCAILPNAIHAEDYAMGPKANALARRLGVDARPVILTFGRMSADERYKGFDEVIEAMPRLVQRIPGICYVAAGDGSDRKRLEAKVQSLGVAENVIFTGRIDEAEKADLYRLADAYVMPSSGEGFGFVVLEALACGIPVVASAIDGTREAVRDGELGLLVNPRDTGAVENAIVEAMLRPKGVPPGFDYFSFRNFRARLEAALRRVVRV